MLKLIPTGGTRGREGERERGSDGGRKEGRREGWRDGGKEGRKERGGGGREGEKIERKGVQTTPTQTNTPRQTLSTHTYSLDHELD